MLTIHDLVSLPCPPDLVESGIACACRSLACPGPGSSSAEHLRQVVTQTAVELAFRRHLQESGVPFAVLPAKPFGASSQYDLSLGGHRCLLESSLVSQRRQVALLQRHRTHLLHAPALFPLERFSTAEGKPDDILVFAFLLAEIAASQKDVGLVQAAGGAVSLVHPLPSPWARPAVWAPLDNLALKSESGQPLSVELTGQDASRQFVTLRLELPPLTRVPLPVELYSVTCLRLWRRPEARVGLHSPRLGEAYLVQPFGWNSLWIQGTEILLTGWLTREDYRRRAGVLNPGNTTSLGVRLREKHLLVPVEDLNPLNPLLVRVKAWAAEKLKAAS